MLMNSSKASLLIVDVQTRLLPAIADGETVLQNCIWLTGVARRLAVPVVVSEQYPAGLGRTADALLEAAGDARIVEKTHFSCVSDGCLAGTAVDERRQVVVVGTEAHVCVLQTVLELRWHGPVAPANGRIARPDAARVAGFPERPDGASGYPRFGMLVNSTHWP